MLNGLDLFSGIGGISLALQPWVRTVCYVEIDRYCQAVLMSRMRSGDLDHAPIWDDIQTFDPRPWIGKVDIVFGGFPCQDISLAGNGAGLAGERSGLFYEMHRVIGELRPRYVFLENVPAITIRGGREVVGSLATLGYDARWGMLSAYDVGAPHLRERWWCLAHAKGNDADCSRRIQREGAPIYEYGARSWNKPSGSGEVVAHSNKPGLAKRERKDPDRTRENSGAKSIGINGWLSEPTLGRVAHGVPYRVDRIKGLGNSVVPACAREAFQRLMGITI